MSRGTFEISNDADPIELLAALRLGSIALSIMHVLPACHLLHLRMHLPLQEGYSGALVLDMQFR